MKKFKITFIHDFTNTCRVVNIFYFHGNFK